MSDVKDILWAIGAGQTEHGLRRSQGYFRALPDPTNDIIYIVSRQGLLLYANQPGLNCIGMSSGEVVGKRLTNLFPPDVAQSHIEKIERIFASGQTLVDDELFRFGTDEVWLCVHLFPLLDEADQVTAIMGMCHDITGHKQTEEVLRRSREELEQRVERRTSELRNANERLRAEVGQRRETEQALRSSEAKYRALVESSPDAIVMCDLEGAIMFASRRAAQQHGFEDGQELVGRAAIEFVVPEDRIRMVANMHRLVKDGIHRNHKYRALRRDGTTFFGNISASVITGPAGKPRALMGVYQDITERKRAENALRQADAELLAASRIQARLLPNRVPRFEGFDIAGQCYSARAAAGDHFDYLRRADGSLLIVLADVSGHGIGPAMVAADFCARLRTLAEMPCELTEVAERIHAGLYGETGDEIFVTAILGRLDPEARTFSYINAGHPPAIVLDSTGRERARCESGGLPFAILESSDFVVGDAVALEAGDILLLYSDGLIEAGRDEYPEFGLDRAIQVVRENRHRSSGEIIEEVHTAVCEYIAPQSSRDDITMVVVKVLKPGIQLNH